MSGFKGRADPTQSLATRPLVTDSVEKGGCCDAEVTVIQSVQLTGLKIMMGHRQVEQAALFYEFSLEKHVPADHLSRSTFHSSGESWLASTVITKALLPMA